MSLNYLPIPPLHYHSHLRAPSDCSRKSTRRPPSQANRLFKPNGCNIINIDPVNILLRLKAFHRGGH